MDEPLLVTTKRGFAAGDNAAAAARKNHELGTAHRFTHETASEAGRRGLEKRWAAHSSALTASGSPVTPDGGS